MALTRPILYSTVAFDANQEHIFNFNVIGGDQVVRNQLTIIRQYDNEIVYQSSQEGFVYNHVLTANSLINGEYYLAYIQTYNYLNQISSNSNSIQFYCYTTPTFNFQNIPLSGIINSQSYDFEVYYYQNEFESLNSYIFNLYNSQGNLIATSGTLYSQNLSNELVISYKFDGFANNTNYYVRATGITAEGTQISTNLNLFYVQYTTPPEYSIIELNNNCENGYITIKSNLVEIDGQSYPAPPIYTDNNTSIDLTNSEDYVSWGYGYKINGDFLASLWGHDFNDNTTIITMKDAAEENSLIVNYKKYDNNLYYAELFVNNGNVYYYIYSNMINILNGDNIQVVFKRIGNLYQINLYNLE